MADESPEQIHQVDTEHYYSNNRQIHLPQPDFQPKGQTTVSIPLSPYHLPFQHSGHNLTNDRPQTFQTSQRVYAYTQLAPPSAGGYDQQQRGPYPGYTPDNIPPAGYPNCMSPVQQLQQPQVFQTLPGHGYPEPTPTGAAAAGSDQLHQGPYPGYAPQNAYNVGGYSNYMPPQQQQQQQQQQIINDDDDALILQASSPTRKYMHAKDILLACFVFWFCGALIGFIALIIALKASDVQFNGTQAQQLSYISRRISIAGIIVGIIVIPIVIGVKCGPAIRDSIGSASSSCNHVMEGSCYKHRSYYSSSYSCKQDHGNSAVYSIYSNFCYY